MRAPERESLVNTASTDGSPAVAKHVRPSVHAVPASTRGMTIPVDEFAPTGASRPRRVRHRRRDRPATHLRRRCCRGQPQPAVRGRENVGAHHLEVRVAISGLGQERREIDARVECAAEQQRYDDRTSVSVGRDRIEYLRNRRGVQIEEREPDIPLGVPGAQDCERGSHGPRRARVTAAVRDSDQRDHAGTRSPSSISARPLPTSPAARVLPPAGSMSRKLPVRRLTL